MNYRNILHVVRLENDIRDQEETRRFSHHYWHDIAHPFTPIVHIDRAPDVHHNEPIAHQNDVIGFCGPLLPPAPIVSLPCPIPDNVPPSPALPCADRKNPYHYREGSGKALANEHDTMTSNVKENETFDRAHAYRYVWNVMVGKRTQHKGLKAPVDKRRAQDVADVVQDAFLYFWTQKAKGNLYPTRLCCRSAVRAFQRGSNILAKRRKASKRKPRLAKGNGRDYRSALENAKMSLRLAKRLSIALAKQEETYSPRLARSLYVALLKSGKKRVIARILLVSRPTLDKRLKIIRAEYLESLADRDIVRCAGLRMLAKHIA